MANASDITPSMVALIKGMIARGDRQFDIAVWFSLPLTHISNIATRKRKGTAAIAAAPPHLLPPAGPYDIVSVDAHTRLREAAAVPLQTLTAILERLDKLQATVEQGRQHEPTYLQTAPVYLQGTPPVPAERVRTCYEETTDGKCRVYFTQRQDDSSVCDVVPDGGG